MKKINPKVSAIAILLLTLLITGGIAVQDGLGDPTVTPADPGDDGTSP
ncbi:MAG: hypothetical protein ACFFDW_07225 [Candidatus Thorarchaeota archaeon]